MNIIPTSKRLNNVNWERAIKKQDGIPWQSYREKEANSAFEVCCNPEKPITYNAPRWVSKG